MSSTCLTCASGSRTEMLDTQISIPDLCYLRKSETLQTRTIQSTNENSQERHAIQNPFRVTRLTKLVLVGLTYDIGSKMVYSYARVACEVVLGLYPPLLIYTALLLYHLFLFQCNMRILNLLPRKSFSIATATGVKY